MRPKVEITETFQLADPKHWQEYNTGKVLAAGETVEEAIQALRRKSSTIFTANFSGLDLSGLDLRKYDFVYCCFDRCRMLGTQWQYTEFMDCSFMDAEVLGARFQFCHFTGPYVLNAGNVMLEPKAIDSLIAFRGEVEPTIWQPDERETLSQMLAELPATPSLSKDGPGVCELHAKLKFIETTARLRGWPLLGAM